MTARTTVYNTDPTTGSVVQCDIWTDSGRAQQASTPGWTQTQLRAQGASESGFSISNVVVNAAVTLTADPDAVRLHCVLGTLNGTTYYAGTSITAIKVANLTVQP